MGALVDFIRADDTIQVTATNSNRYTVLIVVVGILLAGGICAVLVLKRKQRREMALIEATKELIRSV